MVGPATSRSTTARAAVDAGMGILSTTVPGGRGGSRTAAEAPRKGGRRLRSVFGGGLHSTGLTLYRVHRHSRMSCFEREAHRRETPQEPAGAVRSSRARRDRGLLPGLRLRRWGRRWWDRVEVLRVLVVH